MRKLYNEFFYIPKYGKIREKVIVMRITLTVLSIVVCLIAMSLTAFAYFSCNVASTSNVIKAANFETKVSIRITALNGDAVTVNTSDRKSHWAELKADTKYYITLQHTAQSTAKTGFVIVTADKCDNRYHTQQLGRDGNGNTETITFSITPSENTKVYFFSHWGTSSYYDTYKHKGGNEELYITQGENVKLVINVDVNSEKNENDEQSSETTDPPIETVAPETTGRVPDREETTQTNETTTPETTGKDEPIDKTEPTPIETVAPETTGRVPDREETTQTNETTTPETTSKDEMITTTEPTSTETTILETTENVPDSEETTKPIETVAPEATGENKDAVIVL